MTFLEKKKDLGIVEVKNKTTGDKRNKYFPLFKRQSVHNETMWIFPIEGGMRQCEQSRQLFPEHLSTCREHRKVNFSSQDSVVFLHLKTMGHSLLQVSWPEKLDGLKEELKKPSMSNWSDHHLTEEGGLVLSSQTITQIQTLTIMKPWPPTVWPQWPWQWVKNLYYPLVSWTDEAFQVSVKMPLRNSSQSPAAFIQH